MKRTILLFVILTFSFVCSAQIPSESNIVKDGGNLAVFRTMALLGDSLGSGEMAYGAAKQEFTHYRDMYDYSWMQFLARACGSTAYCYSCGGMSARAFMTSLKEPIRKFFEDGIVCQAYFIAMGHNDYNAVSRGWQRAGYDSYEAYLKVYLGSRDDVHTEDPARNADTYYGNYARMIQAIKEKSPEAKIFVITMMNEEKYGPFNEAIRQMPGLFSNTYLVDMAEYFPDMPDWHYTEGHGNAMGYLAYSQRIATIADWIMRNNREWFMYTALIGTDLESYIPESAKGSYPVPAN